jgi:hypothetical protein
MNEKTLLKFDGKLNTIEARTLIDSLSSYVTILEEANKSFYPNDKIDIKVTTFRPGSFIVEIDIIKFITNELLFENHLLTNLGSITTVAASLYGLRKFLKGRKPKEIAEKKDGIVLTNSSNDKLELNRNIFNIYNSNVSIKEALNNHFEALNQDKSVVGFSISNGEKKLFEVKNEEVSELTNQEEIIDERVTEKTIKVKTSVTIFKIVFQKNYCWVFIYKGNKISAKIEDSEYIRIVDAGEKFSKGDILEVEIEIKQIFDKSINTYLNKKFTITKILNHYSKNFQESLNI